jgi:hypothetical protein
MAPTVNGALFDPDTQTLIISASLEDLSMWDEDPNRVAIRVENLDEGIEIIDQHDRLWRPA